MDTKELLKSLPDSIKTNDDWINAVLKNPPTHVLNSGWAKGSFHVSVFGLVFVAHMISLFGPWTASSIPWGVFSMIVWGIGFTLWVFLYGMDVEVAWADNIWPAIWRRFGGLVKISKAYRKELEAIMPHVLAYEVAVKMLRSHSGEMPEDTLRAAVTVLRQKHAEITDRVYRVNKTTTALILGARQRNEFRARCRELVQFEQSVSQLCDADSADDTRDLSLFIAAAGVRQKLEEESGPLGLQGELPVQTKKLAK